MMLFASSLTAAPTPTLPRARGREKDTCLPGVRGREKDICRPRMRGRAGRGCRNVGAMWRRMHAWLVVAMLNVATITQSQAQSAPAGKFADPATAVSLPSSGVSSMGQVTVALVIVLAVLFAAAWAMRQFKMFARPGQGSLEVLQGINLGPKERAVLIKVDGRRLLLGVAPGCVNLLLELQPDSSGEPVSHDPNTPTTDINAPSFKALLKRSMGLS